MDIDEAEIKHSAVFTDFTAKRINHYNYFSSKNLNGKTITCGEKSLKTACDIRQGLLMLGIPAGSPVCMQRGLNRWSNNSEQKLGFL